MNIQTALKEIQALLESEDDLLPQGVRVADVSLVRKFLVELMGDALSSCAVAQAERNGPAERYFSAAFETLVAVFGYLQNEEQALDPKRLRVELDPLIRGRLPSIVVSQHDEESEQVVEVELEDAHELPREFTVLTSTAEWNEIQWQVSTDASQNDDYFMTPPRGFPVLVSVEWLLRDGYYSARPIFVYPEQAKELVDAAAESSYAPAGPEVLH